MITEKKDTECDVTRDEFGRVTANITKIVQTVIAAAAKNGVYIERFMARRADGTCVYMEMYE